MCLSDIPVLFKVNLILMTFQEIPMNSSTFKACAKHADISFNQLIKFWYLLHAQTR